MMFTAKTTRAEYHLLGREQQITSYNMHNSWNNQHSTVPAINKVSEAIWQVIFRTVYYISHGDTTSNTTYNGYQSASVICSKFRMAELNINEDIKIPPHEIILLAKISAPNKHSRFNGLNSVWAELEVSLDVEVGGAGTGLQFPKIEFPCTW